MTLWSQRMREWVDCFFTRHDDTYLAEKLARAVETHCAKDYCHLGDDCVRVALRDYRRAFPRDGGQP